MKENWNEAIVTEIRLAMQVTQGRGRTVHSNRPSHGLVLNDGVADKIIVFEDGTSLHTRPNELHYLPKGSSYRIREVAKGDCYAINFDLLEDPGEAPFSILLKNPESARKLFREAVTVWNQKPDYCNAFIRKSIYEIIVLIKKEQQRAYLPGAKERLIQPAVDRIRNEFTDNALSVSDLARTCHVSEAYFRRLFLEKFSTSPKEYIIQLRMEHAKRLLQSKQFSVNEVAELCGYPEPCHFSREFSKRVGISPKKYKAE